MCNAALFLTFQKVAIRDRVFRLELTFSQKGVPREPHLVERGSRPGLSAALAWSAGALIKLKLIFHA